MRILLGFFLFFFSAVSLSIGDNHINKGLISSTASATDKQAVFPAELKALPVNAVEIYNLAKVNKWHEIRNNFDKLKKSEQSLKLKKNEENDFLIQRLRKKIEELEQAISAKNRRETMRSANKITLIAVAMIGQFKLRVPTDVMVLNYCGREMEILSEDKDIDKLFSLVMRMHLIWQNLIPQLVNKNASKEIKNFSEIMKHLEVAKTPTEFNRLAKQVLDEVDNLEKVFTK